MLMPKIKDRRQLRCKLKIFDSNLYLLTLTMCALKIWMFVTVLLVNEIECILEQDVQPKSYKLKLLPFLDNSFNFTGEVFIDIHCKFSTTEILLHSSNLTILEVQVTRSNGSEFPSSYELFPKRDLLRIGTHDYMVFDGVYKVHIKYQGYLNDDMIGFYKSSYKVGHRTKWLATTQFQSNFARMAFPCFDEPRYRTVFDISVARYKNQIALSNMPVKETSEEDPTINNRVWDTFRTTPPMSTYLVAVVVSDFTRITSEDGRISVWTREPVIKDANYSLSQSSRILERLEIYTDIDFMLPKLDLVAMPDFKSGAMENWGLTIYRERSILHQYDNSWVKQMEVITLIITHELVHQWFGDYVTPQLWDYLWLNEAFATYFKYTLSGMIEPNWHLDELFVTEVVQHALFVDEVNYHHAMTTPVATTAEIEEIFDFITYQKGASVLRMFEHIMSSNSFRKALQYYLKQGHTDGGIVTPDSLWAAFDRQAIQDELKLPLPPSDLMKDWTTNRGYPILNITRITKNQSIIVEQSTYTSPRSSTSSNVPQQNWTIPLTYTTSRFSNFANTIPTHWSGINSTNFTQLHIPLKKNEWIIFNIQQTGYYRVNYDLHNWKLLIKQLHLYHEDIHVLNRAQIIDDSFVLAIDEKLSYDVPINLTYYLANETNMIPWFAAIRNFHYLFSQYENTPINDTIRKYFTRIIDTHYKRIGFYEQAGDDHLTKTGRSSMITLACLIGHLDCVTKVKKLYEIYSDNLSKVPTHLKFPLYCTMLYNGNTDIVWRKLWHLHETTDSAFEIEMILSTAGCINDDKLMMSILEKLISDNNNDIRKQNKVFVLRSISLTSNGVTTSLNFIANLLSKQTNLNLNTIAKLTAIAKKIKSQIKSEEQTKLLKKLITDMYQDNKNLTTLLNALKNAYQEGTKRIQLSKKRMDELKNSIENCMQSSSFFDSTISADDADNEEKKSFTTKLIPSCWLSALNLSVIFICLKSLLAS